MLVALALRHTIEIKGAPDELATPSTVGAVRRFGGRATAAGFWQRAHAWLAAHGITIERALTDNGACYCSRLWLAALADTGETPNDPPLPARTTGRWSVPPDSSQESSHL